jgi:hypothetical protein
MGEKRRSEKEDSQHTVIELMKVKNGIWAQSVNKGPEARLTRVTHFEIGGLRLVGLGLIKRHLSHKDHLLL